MIEGNWTQKTINQWARDTFGHPDNVDVLVARFAEEMGEFVAAAIRGESLEDEAADLVIFLYQIAQAESFHLLGAVDRKMNTNQKRKWKLNHDGSGQHVDEERT